MLLALPGAAGAMRVQHRETGHSHSYRFLVVQKLKRGLRGTPLARHAFLLESEGWRWNINPFLVASIAGTESSFGAAACGGNAWGIGNCGFSFSSFGDGIHYATRLLRTELPEPRLRHARPHGSAICGLRIVLGVADRLVHARPLSSRR